MDDIKKLIRSILISSPLEMDVTKLNRDYGDINGTYIPFQQFGFKTLSDFLQSIPDVVKMHGTGPHARVLVVSSNKSAHIDKLVSKQRVAPPKKSRSSRVKPCIRRRTATPASETANKSFYDNTFNSFSAHNQLSYNFSNCNSRSTYQRPPRFQDRSDVVFNKYHQTYNNSAVPLRSIVTNSPNKSIINNSTDIPSLMKLNLTPPAANLLNSSTEKKSISNFNNTFKPAPLTSAIVELPHTTVTNDGSSSGSSTGAIPKMTAITKSLDDLYYSDEDCYLSDIEEQHTDNVPYAVRDNLKKLISPFDEGIWCAEVPNIYEKMYKKPLDYTEYGYRSLILMCMDLADIFYCFRPSDGDFLLFDKRKPKPIEAIIKIKCKEQPTVTESDYTKAPIQSALPDLTDIVNNDVEETYPHDVLRLGDEIPQQFICDDVQEMSYIEVEVGEVYDPSKFWVLLKDYSADLNSLMDDMQNFYTSIESNFLLIPASMVKYGLYCAAKYNQEYHRAIIVNVVDVSRVKVYYVDYGTVSTISSKGLMFLRRNYIKLNQQAVRARLANVWPKKSYTFWDQTASSRFLNLVMNKTLIAQLYKIHKDRKILEIFLADTTTDQDIYVNDVLVSEGYACFTHQKQDMPKLPLEKIPKYKHIYLYPTFEELEMGKYPSATELIRLYKLAITNETIFCDYFLSEDEVQNHIKNNFREDKYTETNEECSDVIKIKDLDLKSEDIIISTDWTEEINQSVTDSDDNSPDSCKIPETKSILFNSPPLPQRDVVRISKSIQPPPGFHQYPVSSVTPQPVIVTNQPVNFITQQIIDPRLLQTTAANDFSQQRLPTNSNFNWTEKNIPWGMPQTPQTNLAPPQQKFPNVQQQMPPLMNQTMLKQTLHNVIYQGVVSENLNILSRIRHIIEGKPKEIALFRIIWGVITNDIKTFTPLETHSIILELINSLDEPQLIELATIQAISEELSKSVGNAQVSNYKQMCETLTNMMVYTSISRSSVGNNVPSSYHETREQRVSEIEVDNCKVHLIKVNNHNYVILSDILQFTEEKYSIESLRKLIVMADPSSSIVDIHLKDDVLLAEELQRYKITDQVLQLVPFSSVSKVVQILNGPSGLFKNLERL